MPGSQTCPLGQSPLTVRAGAPAARTREVWKSLGAGSWERGVPHTRWALAACSGGTPESTDRLPRPVLAQGQAL